MKYRVTFKLWNKNSSESVVTEDIDIPNLMHHLEHCRIDYFKIELSK